MVLQVKAKTKEPAHIYRLKATLKGSKPPIWRRLEVPGDTTLSKLHIILQLSMGWFNRHLHQFIAGEEYYAPKEFELDAKGVRGVKLSRIAPGEKAKFVYEDNLGDGWEHVILVEKILPREEGKHYPCCTDGKRACPPEDCGGVWGYAELLEAIQDPGHPEHEEFREWAGEDFDPEAFDREMVNEYLKSLR